MWNYNPSGYNPSGYSPTGYGMPRSVYTEVVKVHGEEGANAFRLEPNSSILLLDETQPVVWLKVTDGAGYATLSPYSISPLQKTPPVDIQSLEARIKRIEDMINAKPGTETIDAAKDGK